MDSFSFKRVPQSVADTAPLLTVTFNRRVDRTAFEDMRIHPEYYDPRHMFSAAEVDSLCERMDRTSSWTRVRQIRLIRHFDYANLPRDTFFHYFTFQLVRAGNTHQREDELISAPAEFRLSLNDFRPAPAMFHFPAQPGLAQQLTEQLRLRHRPVPVSHHTEDGETVTFEDHVFSVP